MEILAELIKAVVTVGVIAAIGIIMGGLFIIILSLATGIDNHIQSEDER